MKKFLSSVLVSGLILAPLTETAPAFAQLAVGDPVLYWNAVAIQATADDMSQTYAAKPDQPGPTGASRALAIVHIAIYDAVNSINPTHEPYLKYIPQDAPTSLDAAVAASAYKTLVALFPHHKPAFDTALQNSLGTIVEGNEKTRGIALGNAVAEAILEARKNDNSNAPMEYYPSPEPGKFRPDPINPLQMILGPQWGRVTPFTMESGSQFRSIPPPALDSSEYAAAFIEVKRMGGDSINTPMERNDYESDMGIYWAYDGVNKIGTPPRLYNQIVRQIAIQRGNTVEENARLFALVNIAQADAGIAAWESKYYYNFWRPVEAIRQADEGTGPTGKGDGNPLTVGDPNWTPLGAPASNADKNNFTPPFPAYPSGHATFGAAAFKTVELFYGTADIPFTFTSDEMNGVTTDNKGVVRANKPRNYKNLHEAIWENARSRIYLGVHWHFDATAGMDMGNAIADQMMSEQLQATDRFKPDLMIEMQTLSLVGKTEPISVALTIRNTGGSAASGVTLKVNTALPSVQLGSGSTAGCTIANGVVTCAGLSIAAGQSVQRTVVLSQNTLPCGPTAISSSVTFSGFEKSTTNNSAGPATVNVHCWDDEDHDDEDEDEDDEDGLTIDITEEEDPVERGDTIVYEIRLRNNTNQDKTMDIEAELDDDMTFRDASDNGDEDDNIVLWEDFDIDADSTETLRLEVRNDADDGDKVTLKVRAGDAEATETTRSDEYEFDGWISDYQPGSSHYEPTSNQRDVIVEKTADRSESQPGSIVTYTIAIKNGTNRDLRDVLVEERFPQGSLNIQTPDGARFGNGTIEWRLDTIEANTITTLRYSARVSASASHGQTIVTSVSVRSSEGSAQDSHNLHIISQLPQTGTESFSRTGSVSSLRLPSGESESSRLGWFSAVMSSGLLAGAGIYRRRLSL